MIFATIFGDETVDERGGIETTTYYVPAIITLAVVSATMQTLAMSLVIAREDGRLKRGRGHAAAGLGLHRRPGRQLDRRRGADAGPGRRDRPASSTGSPIPWERLPASARHARRRRRRLLLPRHRADRG